MDVYKLDQSISSNIGNAPPPEKIQPQVTFDAGAEFNLSFFDNPDDHESTQGFSDPGSVGSAPEPSPPPPPQQQQSPLTPQQGASSSSSTSSSSLVQLQPPTSSVAIKQGRVFGDVGIFLGVGKVGWVGAHVKVVTLYGCTAACS